MFKLTYRYQLNAAKPGTITLIATPRTYLQALKPIAVVYGIVGVVVLGFLATDKLVEENKLGDEIDPTEND